MIRRFWNHTVRLYREPSALSSRDGLGHVDLLPEPVGDAPESSNARPDQEWAGGLAQPGPGEQQVRMRRWFVDKALQVRERDVLVVTSGPESGVRLRVHSAVPVTHFRGVHHMEVVCEAWHGDLATESPEGAGLWATYLGVGGFPIRRIPWQEVA